MSDLDNEEYEATKKIYIDGIPSEDYGRNSLSTYSKQYTINPKIDFEEKELDEMIKSTEKSIEGTCKFLKDNFFIEYKEKSADEMFEELGYEKDEKHTRYIKYDTSPSSGIIISFNLLEKWVCADTFDEVAEWNDAYDIDMDELKAINKKCQELRMDMKVKFKYYIKIIIWIRVPKKIFFSRIAGYFYCMQKGEWL